MRQLLLFASLLAAASSGAQPVLTNGFGFMASVNGNTLSRIGNVGTGNFGNVTASGDGSTFFATGANTKMLYWVSASSFAITDSMLLPVNMDDLCGATEPNTLLAASGHSLYRINTASKALDSILYKPMNLTGTGCRMEERPGAKEIWISSDSSLYVYQYVTSLSLVQKIKVGYHAFDVGEVRFTPGGSIAYKARQATKTLVKLDAATKTILDSLYIPGSGVGGLDLSHDSSRLWIAAGTARILILATSNLASVDSITNMQKMAMTLYRHPQRDEIWVVHHFADSLTVYNQSTKAELAGIPIGNDPFFIAFGVASLGTSTAALPQDIKVFPNPAKDVLIIEDGKRVLNKIDIYDLQGRLVAQPGYQGARTTIILSGLVAGSYFLQMQLTNGTTATRMIVKE